MNVLFHMATAVATMALLAKPAGQYTGASKVLNAASALVTGIVFHGILDYMPHGYPVHSKADALLSLLFIMAILFKAGKPYRLLVASAIAGCLLPDIIDLGPAIAEKAVHADITHLPKIFPWHWPEYSGSQYAPPFVASWVNHIMVIALVGIVCHTRKATLIMVFRFRGG